MKKNFFSKLLKLNIFLNLFLAGQLFSQCMMDEVPLTQRIKQSLLIIEGKVVEQNSYWNKAHTNIFTSSRVEVYKLFKGKVVYGQVEVITEGGIVGYDMERVDPGLQLSADQVGIFFLESCQNFLNLDLEKKSSATTFRTYAGMQGFILYDLDERTAIEPFRRYNNIKDEIYSAIMGETGIQYKEINFFDLNASQKVVAGTSIAPSITSFSPAVISAGTFSALTINGSGFGATRGSSVVKFKNADNGGTNYIQPDASQYISWTDAQIKVQVPVWVTGSTGNAGSGTIQVSVSGSTATSSSALTVTFGVFNIQWPQSAGSPIQQMNCVNNNGNGGTTVQFSNTFASNTAAVAAFKRAFNSWRCGSFVNWEIGANTSVNSQTSDGITVVRFSNSGELSSGVNATTNSWWSGCAPAGDVWYLKDWDMVFNSSKNWNYTTSPPTSSQNDLESTALHELGHAQLLTHVNQSTDVMYWATSPGVMLRTLTPEVLGGAQYVMARAAVPQSCGPGAMTLLNASNCALGVNEDLEKENEVEIFPNPSNGIFKISSSNAERNFKSTEIEIYNGLGNKIKQLPASYLLEPIDITSEMPGVYFIRIRYSDGNYISTKLIKQ